MAVASLVFAGMIVIYHTPVTLNLLYVPVIVLLELILTTGVVLLASAVNVYYRDVRFVIPLASQIWMYASPVIYPISVVPPRLLPLYTLNPMAGLIDSFRLVTVAGQPPDLRYLGEAAVISILVFVLSYRYFKKVEMGFADAI
jgi:lipopolysaccharide transport system permease protein